MNLKDNNRKFYTVYENEKSLSELDTQEIDEEIFASEDLAHKDKCEAKLGKDIEIFINNEPYSFNG